MAIAGDDFVAIGCDTRLTRGYSILTRNQEKVFQLTPKTFIASTGCWADVLTLTKNLETRLTVSIIIGIV